MGGRGGEWSKPRKGGIISGDAEVLPPVVSQSVVAAGPGDESDVHHAQVRPKVEGAILTPPLEVNGEFTERLEEFAEGLSGQKQRRSPLEQKY